MIPVVQLLRVSTESQASLDRAGLDSQRDTNRRTCLSFGLEIIETVEIVESGADVAQSPAHGDLPLETQMASSLADLAVEQRVPMILSLRHLRKGQQQAFVTAFAALEHRGIPTPARTTVAAWSDQSKTPAGFEKNLSQLSQSGFIERLEGKRLALTEGGRSRARWEDASATLADYHESWRSQLSDPQWRILSVLIGIYPIAIAREKLAERSGQASTPSGFEKNLSGLSSLGLIERLGKTNIAASELLFPEGLS